MGLWRSYWWSLQWIFHWWEQVSSEGIVFSYFGQWSLTLVTFILPSPIYNWGSVWVRSHQSVMLNVLQESLTQDYDAKYWRQRYSLKDGIPSFLSNIAGTILITGKYLNVMRECGHHVQVLLWSILYICTILSCFCTVLYLHCGIISISQWLDCMNKSLYLKIQSWRALDQIIVILSV